MSRIAVPYDDGRVYEHFGRATRFLLCDATEDGAVMSVVDVDTPGSGSGVADFLGRSRVDVVVCTGMGEGARGHLSDHGITIVTCSVDNAEAAARAYIDGTLSDDSTRVHGEGCCRSGH